MASFLTFSPFLSSWEGGYSDNKNDNGKQTYRGVTAATWAAYCKRKGIVMSLRRMTQAQWADIMKTGYWDACRCSDLLSQSVANCVADFAVNAGASRSARYLQLAINEANHDSALNVDGKIGPKTIAAANALNPSSLYWTLRELRTEYYKNLARTATSTQATFLKGWLRRVEALGFGKFRLNDLRSTEITFADKA